MSSPAIILRSKFVSPQSNEFKNYIEYIDRKEGKINVDIDYKNKNNQNEELKIYHSYMNYMDDSRKDGQLFNDSKDIMSDEEIKLSKKNFTTAQKNGSPMWQDVISFDNKFLEEIGVYDSSNGYTDEKKLKNVAKNVVREMANNENMDINSIEWTGAIHHNTDNIHIHLAITEPNPTRKLTNYNGEEQYRGKRKPKTIEKMKRSVANNLYDRNKNLQKINELIRQPAKDKKNMTLNNDSRFAYHFHKALEKLPDNKKEWQYGYFSINNAREHIDSISEEFMNTFYPDTLEELKNELDKQVDESKKLFGEGSRAEDYKDNKLNDLKKRLGNAVLQEMRNYDSNNSTETYPNYKQRISFSNIKEFRDTGKVQIPSQQNNYSNKDYSNVINISKFNKAMRKSYHDYMREKDMQEFDRMQEGLDLE